VRATLAVAVVAPEAPVTVIVYRPGVVPLVEDVLAGVRLPPQATSPPAITRNKAAIPRNRRQERRRRGIPKSRMQARAAPPEGYQGNRLRAGLAVAVVGAVVEMVRVAMAEPLLLTLAGEDAPKLRVGRCLAPTGAEAIEAVRVTVPVKPPAGVMETVDAFAVVAPAATVTDVVARAKDAGAAAATVSFNVLELLDANPVVP
jgi:hypothetical protein